MTKTDKLVLKKWENCISLERETTILKNWEGLQNNLKDLDEVQCWYLLEREQEGLRRPQFLLRIYGRANKLRGKREREKLFQPTEA